jgi:hypothetical protein
MQWAARVRAAPERRDVGAGIANREQEFEPLQDLPELPRRVVVLELREVADKKEIDGGVLHLCIPQS